MNAVVQQTPEQPGTENLPVAVRAQKALAGVATETALIEMAAQAKEITSITNKAGRDQCHAMMMRLANARVAITKTGKAKREDATAFCKAVIGREKFLIDIIQPEETRLETMRDKWDADRKAEKEAAAKAEQDRIDGIYLLIDEISGRAVACGGKSSAEIRAALEKARAYEIDPARFAEFEGKARAALATSIATMETLLANTERAEHAAALAAGREAIRRAYLIPPLASLSAAQVQAIRDELAEREPDVHPDLFEEATQARTDALAALDDAIAIKAAAEQLAAEQAEFRQRQEEERKRQEAEDEKRRQAEAYERQIRDAMPTRLISAGAAHLRHEAETIRALNPNNYAPLITEAQDVIGQTLNVLGEMAEQADTKERQELEMAQREAELRRQEEEVRQKREREERERQAEQERQEAQRRETEEAARREQEEQERAEREAAEAARTRLETAAPKLLSLLEEAVNIIGEYAPGFTVWLDSAEAAIAEATGEAQ